MKSRLSRKGLVNQSDLELRQFKMRVRLRAHPFFVQKSGYELAYSRPAQGVVILSAFSQTQPFRGVAAYWRRCVWLGRG